MTVRPIIFSTPMVKALLEGRKTQTRRLAGSPLRLCNVGDLLYVREAFSFGGGGDPGGFVTMADYPVCAPAGVENLPAIDEIKWRPSIHMPRERSRLTLEVTEVRNQRLQQITEEDAEAEGCIKLKASGRAVEQHGAQYFGAHWPSCRTWFIGVWESLHGVGSWKQDRLVVALTFKVHKVNVDTLIEQRKAA